MHRLYLGTANEGPQLPMSLAAIRWRVQYPQMRRPRTSASKYLTQRKTHNSLPPRNRVIIRYNVARIPNYPVTYTFSSLGPTTGAMILVPPPDSPDTRPLYHISVSHDPFLPHCRITSVLQGGSVNGSYVGGFTCVVPHPTASK
jgi:hypothetical protein